MEKQGYSVYLETAQVAQLEQLAKSIDRSTSFLVRRAIAAYLERQQKKGTDHGHTTAYDATRED